MATSSSQLCYISDGSSWLYKSSFEYHNFIKIFSCWILYGYMLCLIGPFMHKCFPSTNMGPPSPCSCVYRPSHLPPINLMANKHIVNNSNDQVSSYNMIYLIIVVYSWNSNIKQISYFMLVPRTGLLPGQMSDLQTNCFVHFIKILLNMHKAL